MDTVTTTSAVRLLTKRLSGVKGRITSADATAITGLPHETVKDALDVLMNTFVCRLRITESGEVLYDFGGSLRRRGSKSVGDKLRDAGELLWKAFTAAFKVWITVMLIVYLVIFLILVLALLFGGRDSKKSIKLGWVGDLFADIFFLSSRNMAVVYALDRDGNRHRAFRQEQRYGHGEAEPKKRLVQSVYDFVFGPPRPNFDPFADEKEVAAWLRREKGVLTLTELVALAGYTFDEASERMASYLGRYRGEAEITDDGVLIGTFEHLLKVGDSGLEGGRVELFWDEYEAPYELTGNSTGRNTAIAAVNAFNLLFALVMFSTPGLGTLLVANTGIELPAGVVQVVLGVIPLLFSVLFFTVPLLRMRSVSRPERLRKIRNIRRRILRAAFAEAGRPLSLQEILHRVNTGLPVPLKAQEVEPILLRMLSDYTGRTDIAEDGTVLFSFERIGHEVAVGRRERDAVSLPASLGEVIFDTGEQGRIAATDSDIVVPR